MEKVKFVCVIDTIDLIDIFMDHIVPEKKNKGHIKIKKDDPIIDTECSICKSVFTMNEYKKILTCNHTFHKKCIGKWIKINENCPICRNEEI